MKFLLLIVRIGYEVIALELFMIESIIEFSMLL